MKRFFIVATCFAFLSIFSIYNTSTAEGEEVVSDVVELSFPSYINENTLAENYITTSLPSQRPILRVSRPSGLIQFPANSPNRNLYIALRSQIAGIADGTNDKQYDDDIGGMSTIFAIPATDIFPATSFSAEDLEVENLFNENGTVSEDAEAAFWSRVEEMKTSIRFSDVAMCVVNDSPYELYWFGRTARVAGNSFEMEPGEDVLGLSGSYRVLFSVSVDYAVPDEITVIDGTAYRTWVDTDRFGSVARAKKKINEIRAAVSGMTDEEKMAYFAEQICSLVSYNYEAEREFKDGTREYGDPWQLVWVFDTRSEQKVVCEGYSKAFAYLCELCTGGAECILVWGSIPAGNHMWNVVKMDGHNYLVDLTNFDLGYDVYLAGADGSVADGYDTKAVKGYVYNREQTKRSDGELTLEAYSYAEWKEATTVAPEVRISSSCTYPEFRVALVAESANGALPVEETIVRIDEAEETISGNTVMLEISEDTEIRIAGVVDGITTPETSPILITVAEAPETVFSLPTGAIVETEVFAGTSVELVQIHGNQVAAGAFDPDVVLAVDEIGDWFGSGYPFVVAAEEEKADD